MTQEIGTKTVNTVQYGTLVVPENFDSLSPADQKLELRKAAKGKTKITPEQQGSMSALEQAQGSAAEFLQGITIGASDEIKAGLAEAFNLPKTIFTEQELGETYTRVRDKERKELEEYARLYPKSALAANISGAVAPVIASTLLGGPAGGTAAAAPQLARAKQILDSSRLLAGGMTKPGASLPKRIAEGAKMGATQGAVGGLGYSETSATEDPGQLALETLGGGLLGTGIGLALPPALSATGYVLKKLFQPIIQTVKKVSSPQPKDVTFTKEEKKEIKNIGADFLQDEIDIDKIILKIQQNISADKLEGVTPVEILADFGGAAVKNKLRGMNMQIPGSAISEQLEERAAGTVTKKGQDLLQDKVSNIQSTRIIQSLKNSANKVVKTEGINLETGVEELSNMIQKKVSPLYKSAYDNNKNVENLEVYKFLEVPIIKKAYDKAIQNYQEIAQKLNPGVTVKIEDLGIPSLEKLLIKNENGQVIGVNRNLPLAFLDQIKRSADEQTWALRTTTASNKISSQSAGNRKNITNQFRDLLKNSVDGDDYSNALSQSSDKFALQEAFEKGQKAKTLIKSKTGVNYSKEYDDLKTVVEKDAFKMGAFDDVLNGINSITDSSNLADKLTNNPNLRNKIEVLFSGSGGFDSFINRLSREDEISKTSKKVLSGSYSGNEQQLSTPFQFMSDLLVAFGEPTGSAGIRSQAKIAQQGGDVLFDTGTKQQEAFKNIMLSTDPKRQQDILKLMEQLRASQIAESERSNLLRSGTIRSTAPYSMEALNQLLFKE